MKKLLFVINTLGQAGAETALLNLLRQIDPKEYEVSLYVLMGQGEMVSELPEYVRLLNRSFHDSPVLSGAGRGLMARRVMAAAFCRGTVFRLLPYLIRNFFAMAAKGRVQADKLLWRLLSDGGQRFSENYDLAVAYLEGGSAYYVADHVKAAKKAAFVHVDYSRAGYNRQLDRDCYLEFDRIFGVSDEVKASFDSVYPECAERSFVFHNLLDVEEIRRKASLPGGFEDDFQGIRVLTVGRLTAQKAYDAALEAMSLLKDRGEQVRWYVLGEGNQRRLLEEKRKKLGLEEDFLLPGAVKNPYPYFRQADIYVHATRFEGKSIAIQEAQILGKPVLVSDCSGNREQVTENVDGLFCDLTPESICEGIQRLAHHPELRDRLGKAAAERSFGDRAEPDKLLELI
ncbi:MAG: glycosyltransferase [Butyrivibrio sp.]|nr:glycosyltransferase [Acetatifactor muris]MCM1559255.1 glycosyltransferase [Butyrivibrio sp.]